MEADYSNVGSFDGARLTDPRPFPFDVRLPTEHRGLGCVS